MATSLIYTPLDKISQIHGEVKSGFASGRSKSISFRKTQLLSLAYMVKDNVKRFEDALFIDTGRPVLEAHLLEIGGTISEALTAYHEVEKWAKTEKTKFSLNFWAMGPAIRKEPKGTVLIIGPFNAPIWSLLIPLIGAIAAGNAVVIKPSELSPTTSAFITELLPKYLDPQLYCVVNGSVAETSKLLELHWDHIFYTGSGRVGKIVSAAAAKHLTPVSLELGGKNPVVIDPNCDMTVAARRILWGKCANSGQLCVAPDYVLVPSSSQDKLVEALKKEYSTFFPDGPLGSSSFSRFGTHGHFTRVKKLLDDTQAKVVLGGQTDAAQKYIAPTIVRDVGLSDSLMSDEIFGPILPIVPVTDVDEAIKIINARHHALVIYVFSQDKNFKSKVFDNTQSGAAVANDTMIHPGVDGLPFGGVGSSGSGYHTGKHGFDIFTHLRATLDSPGFVDYIMSARYPPYTEKNQKFLGSLMSHKMPPRNGSGTGWGKWIRLSLALAVVAAFATFKNRGKLLA